MTSTLVDELMSHSDCVLTAGDKTFTGPPDGNARANHGGMVRVTETTAHHNSAVYP